jgi:hypothetical protein
MMKVHNKAHEIVINTKHHVITVGRGIEQDVWVKIDSPTMQRKIYLGTGSDSHSSSKSKKKGKSKRHG